MSHTGLETEAAFTQRDPPHPPQDMPFDLNKVILQHFIFQFYVWLDAI